MNDSERTYGWISALVRGAIVVVVGTALLVYGPHLILTKLTSSSRSTRVGFATAWFGLWITVLAVALRRLQGRRMV